MTFSKTTWLCIRHLPGVLVLLRGPKTKTTKTTLLCNDSVENIKQKEPERVHQTPQGKLRERKERCIGLITLLMQLPWGELSIAKEQTVIHQ